MHIAQLGICSKSTRSGELGNGPSRVGRVCRSEGSYTTLIKSSRFGEEKTITIHNARIEPDQKYISEAIHLII